MAFAIAAAPVLAQDNDGLFWAERLNQITVSATRTPVRIEDVPASISAKTEEQMADEMVSDIKDLVRFEPGLSVRQSPSRFGAALGVTGRDGASSFNIRGLDGNVLIQVDGVRVPDGFEFGAQAAGRGAYVDLGLVKSVEILRGPASALYDTIPNPDLKPETIEGGIRLSTDHIFASATAFSGDYKNFISQEQVGGIGTAANPIIFQYVNLAKVKIEGLEGKLDLRAENGVNAQLAISYAKGTTTRGTMKSPLASIDPLKLVAGIGWREREGRFGGQVIMTHLAKKAASDAAAGAYRPEAFTILDATAFVKPMEGLTLRAGLFNILDAKYTWWSDVRGLAATSTVTDAYSQPGRNISVSLSYNF